MTTSGTQYMTQPQVSQHPASVDAYIRNGWSLVPIPHGTKGPRTPGWNLKQNALRSQTELPQGYGIGLAHAYSGTMALDLDDWTMAVDVLKQHGIDLQALYDAPDAVIVDSGRSGHGKLLYAMPFGLALPSKKISIGGTTVYELRCATTSGVTVQDVLPPSIHPQTMQPYRWAGRGHWMRLPTIPTELLDLWQSMLAQDTERTIHTGETIPASWAEITDALEYISPDLPHDDWVTIGMALHWAGSQTEQLDQGLHIWNEWSKQSETKYPGEREILHRWASFKSDRATAVKLGSLFHIARRAGWTRPAVDVSEMFKAINEATPPMPPIDLLEGMRPMPPEMNMELWPSILATRATEVAESVGCDPLIPLFAGLAAVCGVVDSRIRLELMPGYQVPPVLWLMTIGDPADKKSPGSKPMLSPLKNIEAEDKPRYAKALLEWQGQEAAHGAAMKAFLEFSASTEAMLSGDQAPAVGELPPQPVSLKFTVMDVTSQKLIRVAAERPRGILCYLDEMNGWVKKLTDKSGGEDRSAWVMAYESESYEMDRVGAGSIHADNLAVSIYGNIQPVVFKANLVNLASDGLVQRFIPAIPRSKNTKRGEPIPDYMSHAAQWEQTLRIAFSLPEMVYKLSPDAYNAFREFQTWYEDAKQDERVLKASDAFMTAFGKLEGTAGRLCLVMHLMENPFSPMVSVDIVIRVVDLIKGYLIPAFRYALADAGGADDTFERWVADWVIHTAPDKLTVNLREVKRSARRPLEGKTEWQKQQAISDAMDSLEAARWVVKLEDEPNKQHMVWALNPSLATMFPDHRARVLKAKQRHVDYIYRIAAATPGSKYSGRKLIKGYDPDTMDE
jgi:Protein of unknown function (DUF3987)/Bifunctional DNA primase/polymerase, N-terminal/Primase C terminal 2 (PriCT-2)